MSFEDVFLSKKIYSEHFISFLVGAFIVGYLNWKKKVKRDDDSAELSHDNAVNK